MKIFLKIVIGTLIHFQIKNCHCQVHEEGTRCTGERGRTFVCLSMGNVGREAWVSPRGERDVAHWHIFPRQHARSRARGLLDKSRRDRAREEGTCCMGEINIHVPFDGQSRG